MSRKNLLTYAKNEVTAWPIPNYWDVLALVLIIAAVILVSLGGRAMLAQYHLGDIIPISISPWHLPYYALRTVLRMLIALACSLVFSFVFGYWAAKSHHAERIIIPLIDILQSVPVLGYLSITLVAFVVLFRGSILGPECAAIFTIFIAQVWNMTLSFYQSVSNVPMELQEAARIFQLNAWQRFWRIEVPYAMPGLIWNMMMSMSGSWVFLVATEAIAVANKTITLPGIGSYISLALQQQNSDAVIYAIITMFVVIGLYDQFIFRPLVAWSVKFRMQGNDEDDAEEASWLLDIFQRTRLFQNMGYALSLFGDWFVNFGAGKSSKIKNQELPSGVTGFIRVMLFYLILIMVACYAVVVLYDFISNEVTLTEVWKVLYLGVLTTLRIFAVIVVSIVVWVPVGVWIGMRPKVSKGVQPIAQFLAAFPANLLFPVAAMLMLKYHLNVNIWCSPLMILGTQWYILFNVIAGVSATPKNLRYAVASLNVTRWLKWRRFISPSIFPYLITGAITATGGAWNITIVAEVIQWGPHKLIASGLGSYIKQAASVGDFPRLALGITIMSIYVLLFNRLLWRPLYVLAQKRYQIR